MITIPVELVAFSFLAWSWGGSSGIPPVVGGALMVLFGEIGIARFNSDWDKTIGQVLEKRYPRIRRPIKDKSDK